MVNPLSTTLIPTREMAERIAQYAKQKKPVNPQSTVEKRESKSYISLTELVKSLKVDEEKIDQAVEIVVEEIEKENPNIAPFAVRKGRGYQMSLIGGASMHISEIFDRIGLFRHQRNMHGKKKSLDIITQENDSASPSITVPLRTYLINIGISPSKLEDAAMYIEELKKNNSPLVSGVGPGKSQGYTVAPTAENNRKIAVLLREKGLFDKSRRKKINKERFQKNENRETILGLKNTPRLSMHSYDFTINETPARISFIAIKDFTNPEGISFVKGYSGERIQDKLGLLLTEATKRHAEGYKGQGNELFRYEQENNILEFRVSHGTVTDITYRRKM